MAWYILLCRSRRQHRHVFPLQSVSIHFNLSFSVFHSASPYTWWRSAEWCLLYTHTSSTIAPAWAPREAHAINWMPLLVVLSLRINLLIPSLGLRLAKLEPRPPLPYRKWHYWKTFLWHLALKIVEVLPSTIILRVPTVTSVAWLRGSLHVSSFLQSATGGSQDWQLPNNACSQRYWLCCMESVSLVQRDQPSCLCAFARLPLLHRGTFTHKYENKQHSSHRWYQQVHHSNY